MTTQAAYTTTDETIINDIHQATRAWATWCETIHSDMQTLGNCTPGQGTLASIGTTTLEGIAAQDPNNPPKGWRYNKTRNHLEPRQGTPGQTARIWLANHQPPETTREALERHRAPRCVSTPDHDDNATETITYVDIAVTPTAVHLRYETEPTDDNTFWADTRGIDTNIWHPEPLSAWHQAHENTLIN